MMVVWLAEMGCGGPYEVHIEDQRATWASTATLTGAIPGAGRIILVRRAVLQRSNASGAYIDRGEAATTAMDDVAAGTRNVSLLRRLWHTRTYYPSLLPVPVTSV